MIIILAISQFTHVPFTYLLDMLASYIEHDLGVCVLSARAHSSLFTSSKPRCTDHFIDCFTYIIRLCTASGVCACPIYKMLLATLDQIAIYN